MKSRTLLSVNVNKLATLRNSRGKNNPDVLKTSLEIVKFGAHGITVHPRPDERHIRRSDVYTLRPAVGVEFNIEGYPSSDFLDLVLDVVPEQCTLVPDPPEALTSNAGWRVAENQELLAHAIDRLHSKNVRVSIFIDPRTVTSADFELMQELKVDRIELYTEEYAEAYPTTKRDEVTMIYRKAAEAAVTRGIGVNAGHDLSLENLKFLIQELPMIDEVSIGHALIVDALTYGFEVTIKRYLECL